MHVRRHKPDLKRTKSLRKEGVMQSRYSYASYRIHPGTQRGCIYLAGQDCQQWREAVLIASRGKCAFCGTVSIHGEADHIAHTNKYERCWCPENGRWLCKPCHRARHPQVQWSKRQAVKDFNKIYGGADERSSASGVSAERE